MPGDDSLEMRGKMELKFEDGRFSLVVTGPQWPADNINPQVEIYWDKSKKMFHLNPGLTATARIDQGSPSADHPAVYDKDYDFGLDDLPEALKKLIGNGPHNGSPVAIPTPDCRFLWLGDRFMTFEEYNQRRKFVNAMPSQPSWYKPPPGGINLFAIQAGNILYPPMSKAMFDRMIARCQGARMFGD